jgi:hypothetical protein
MALVNQRVEPQQAGQAWIAVRDGAQLVVGHHADPARRERDHAVVHLVEKEAVQVDEVAEHVQRGDLAAAVGQDLVAGGEAFQHEAAL